MLLATWSAETADCFLTALWLRKTGSHVNAAARTSMHMSEEPGTDELPLHHCYPVPEHFAMPSLQPYRGTSRKLVLGIDVGTTYSGVAYALLDPGEVPKIHGVTR